LHPTVPKPWRPPADRPGRILIVRLSALGDVIHALPAAASLRRLLPDARIDWAVEERAVSLLAGREEIDQVVVLPRKELRALKRRPRAWIGRAAAFVREMRDAHYDVALDLQGNLKSGLVTRLSGARLRFGMARGVAREANHLFTARRAAPPREARHRVERNLAMVAALLGREAPWVAPAWPHVPEAAAEAERRMGRAGIRPRGFAALHPGTSEFGAFKRWPAERFAELARRLCGEGRDVVLTCAPAEVPRAEAIRARAGNGVAVLSTPSLPVLAEVIRRASLFVSADTGPLHLAALAGTPLVGLFGPKAPAVYGPYGLRPDGTPGLLSVVTRADVACRRAAWPPTSCTRRLRG
jgi:lipopolysaccharide heptosyltransferase I